ncbi:hypothetical protein DFH11DRAFT_1877056 [Phellopilus nigrolimitatus]|nr:hypothetical protein DFH11DRAFT_1877056 [Phellopilus nigrolimitatus]
MYREHPVVTFNISDTVKVVIEQNHRGLSYVSFNDTNGTRIQKPEGVKCYDVSVGKKKFGPHGFEMPYDRNLRYTLCMTNFYEIKQDGILMAELNFSCHHDMYREHPAVTFNISDTVKVVIKQYHRGLSYVSFTDINGTRIPKPEGIECYDISVGGKKFGPNGFPMPLGGNAYYVICKTNFYELKWNGVRVAELNFGWFVVGPGGNRVA